MALRQSLQQKLLQKLSPQQIQLMKLLQVPTVELEQRIKQEIEENPALEEGEQEKEIDDKNDEYEDADSAENSLDDFNIDNYLDDDVPDYRLSARNHSPEADEKAIPLAGGKTFQEVLQQQVALRIKDEQQLIIADHIIGNLDDAGYLRRELFNIVDDLAFSQNIIINEQEIEEVLKTIQELEPYGVGARDLRECLLIQLRKKTKTVPIVTAEEILDRFFEEFTKKHYSKITTRLDITELDVKDALAEIVKLNPKPGNSLIDTNKVTQHIIPDFIVSDNNGEIHLELNNRNAPQLKVNRQYAEMLRAYDQSKRSERDKEAIVFVKQKIDSAKWFIDAIKQRQQTLLVTMQAIINYQEAFFRSGDETDLRPMILKDIAEIVNMDISTISRVANSKHVSTPFGTFILKYFFSESLSTDSGEEVSTREVKRILQDAVEQEDKRKPYTDEKLTNILKAKGYNIARRTVAKYREQLNISVARLRKEL
ncbi:MAG: RNA polymerase factor sigma-54 [Parvicellaceae bacterium]